jgi:hypothetical protein
VQRRLINTHPPFANRGGAASTSSPIRDRVPAEASARECRCEGRRQCRSDTRSRDARPSALWPTGSNRQERFDKIPQRIWKQRGGHARSRYLADEDQVSEVLSHALRRARPLRPVPRLRPPGLGLRFGWASETATEDCSMPATSTFATLRALHVFATLSSCRPRPSRSVSTRPSPAEFGAETLLRSAFARLPARLGVRGDRLSAIARASRDRGVRRACQSLLIGLETGNGLS